MNILLWRSWTSFYDYPGTFSSLTSKSMGGTCTQMLWHARTLAGMGHKVQVLGAARDDIIEEGVEFIGSENRVEQEKLIATGRINLPDFIFLEGAFAAASLFRKFFLQTKIIHIGQNLDRYGYKEAFELNKYIDLYAFVSPGHHADYCVRYPHMRHKFSMIRNIVPWHNIYSRIKIKPVENKILWVGAWRKFGLRQWAETMQRILKEFSQYKWTLCGPTHGAHVGGMPSDIFADLKFPSDRIDIKDLTLADLAQEISSSRIVLVSLGNETACISALDAHAMGRPVVSGNDIVFKYINPEGTGIRVFTSQERYNALVKLIEEPEVCNWMGTLGKELILKEFTEENQKEDIQFALNYLEIEKGFNFNCKNKPPSKLKESVLNYSEKFRRKFHEIKVSFSK